MAKRCKPSPVGCHRSTCLKENTLCVSLVKHFQSRKTQVLNMLLVFGDGCVPQCSTWANPGGKCPLSNVACMLSPQCIAGSCCRREYFLLDTGAGQSWLRFPHMYNIKAQDPEQTPEYKSMVSLAVSYGLHVDTLNKWEPGFVLQRCSSLVSWSSFVNQNTATTQAKTSICWALISSISSS